MLSSYPLPFLLSSHSSPFVSRIVFRSSLSAPSQMSQGLHSIPLLSYRLDSHSPAPLLTLISIALHPYDSPLEPPSFRLGSRDRDPKQRADVQPRYLILHTVSHCLSHLLLSRMFSIKCTARGLESIALLFSNSSALSDSLALSFSTRFGTFSFSTRNLRVTRHSLHIKSSLP